MSKISNLILSLSAAAILNLPLFPTKANASDTIYILPDTQYYSLRDNSPYFYSGSSFGLFPDTYNLQTQSIVDYHYDVNNNNSVKIVLHMGDLTNDNTSDEWSRAQTAHQTLRSAGIPYNVVPGNHDNPDSGKRRDTTKFNQYFGISHFSGEPDWGHFSNTADNNYRTFTIEGRNFLSVNLEFAPRKEALCWANDLIENHPDHHVIITTHCYTAPGGGYDNTCAYSPSRDRFLIGSGGQNVWDELVKRHNNIRMVLSGHHTDSEHRVRTGEHGNSVHEILSDYQFEKYLNSGERYGNGWIRRLVFEEQNTSTGDGIVSVETETVLSGITSFTLPQYNSNPSHSDHNFSFNYNFNLQSYVTPTTLSNYNDFNINKVPTGQQLEPAISINRSNSEFVVAWRDDQNKDGVYRIDANGFNGEGCQLHDQQNVSQTSGQNIQPRIAVAENGNRVVIWQRSNDIYVEGYYADGSLNFSEKRVNPNASGTQRDADVAIDSSGRFVVTWEDDTDGNGWYQIHARAFNANGSPRFSYVTVNQNYRGQQLDPAVAMRDDGRFFVVFKDDKDKNGYYEILGSVFNISGGRVRNDFWVNQQLSAGQQRNPDIASDKDGNLIIVYEDDHNNNGYYNIRATGYNSSFNRVISNYRVNDLDAGQQFRPRVDMVKRGQHQGKYVVTWEDDNDQNGKYQIYMEARNANGSAVSADTTVNNRPEGQQRKPDVAVGNDGRAFFVWEDDLDENSYYEIITADINVF